MNRISYGPSKRERAAQSEIWTTLMGWKRYAKVCSRTKKRKKKLMIKTDSLQVPLFKGLAKGKRKIFRANSTTKHLGAGSHTSSKTSNRNSMTNSQCWTTTKRFPSTIWTELTLTWSQPGTKSNTEESKMQKRREKWLTTKLRENATKKLRIKFKESGIWAQLRSHRKQKESKTLWSTRQCYGSSWKR